MKAKPFLLIDVGNTRLKWAEAGRVGAIRLGGHAPSVDVTAAWVATLAKRQRDRRAVIASVVPRLTTLFLKSFPDAVVVSGRLRGLPLAFSYPRPNEIGADRLAAAVALRGRGPVIIVSCGTATAFSALDAQGRFCGGAIAPGLTAGLDSLILATAQLPRPTLSPNPPALARSTTAAIRAGIVFGHRGAVREITARLRRELGGKARLVVTGGDAKYLRDVKGLGPIEFRPLLVLEGLRIMAAALT